MPIIPDDKDWTWVLSQPCPECHFDASTLAREAFGDLIRSTAAQWTEILSESPLALRSRVSDDRWSPLEYGCHVRDVFQLFDQRLHLMLTIDGPTYPNWDQDQTAREGHYNDQDPSEVSTQLSAAAAVLAHNFDVVTGNQWERTGHRSDGASFTIDTFGRYLIHDPTHHIYDVEQDLPQLRP